jgi:hypothetical protein
VVGLYPLCRWFAETRRGGGTGGWGISKPRDGLGVAALTFPRGGAQFPCCEPSWTRDGAGPGAIRSLWGRNPVRPSEHQQLTDQVPLDPPRSEPHCLRVRNYCDSPACRSPCTLR